MNVGTKEISNKKKNGRFYTPSYMVKNILDISGYEKSTIRLKHVIDNSCGDGAFLCEIVRRYCSECLRLGVKKHTIKHELQTYIHGIEIDETEVKKCIANVSQVAENFGVTNVSWDIICGDALVVRKYDGKMDFVLGNPPYIRVHNLSETLDTIKSFSFAQNGMTDLFIVFYEIGIRMLNKKGVLGYITPSSFFNSLAGKYLRKQFILNNFLDKIVDLKHFQAFSSTTYTTIVVLKNSKQSSAVNYYTFDENNLSPKFCETLSSEDFFISNNFYFGSKEQLKLLKRIFFNPGHARVYVKNGYATLCDDVFINDFTFDSPLILPVIKASRGICKKMIYPYDKNAFLLSETEIANDTNVYKHLCNNKEKLVDRSNEKDREKYWYAFGRSQALSDTYKDKIAINSLLRTKTDIKLMSAPAGTGVYSGLYITSEGVPIKEIESVVKSDEFTTYVSMLGKYKSGGYYTFSSKDLKRYLDYKFAYEGGLLTC